MVNYYKENIGDTLTVDQTTPQIESRFDVLRSSRWHRMRFDFVGSWESSGFIPDVRKDGVE
jgi:predicted lysophospholipase L1 biosynthesis ABC-type transport system permease subunit